MYGHDQSPQPPPRRRHVYAAAAVLAAAILTAGAGVWGHVAGARPATAPVVRGDVSHGRYLTWTYGCQDCHTPRLADSMSLDSTRAMSGGFLTVGPWGALHSANVSRIAPALSDAQLTQAIRGQLGYLYPMPTDAFNKLADADLRDIVAYLRTVRRVDVAPLVDSINPTLAMTPRNQPVAVAAVAPTGNSLARGAYLVGGAGCGDCHTPLRADGTPDAARTLAGGGAVPFPNPDHYVPPNLTPDSATGIGTWSDVDIMTVLRFGRAPDGHQITPLMPYTSGWHVFTDDDLVAIVRYLRSLPPVRNPLPVNPVWRRMWQPGPWMSSGPNTPVPGAPGGPVAAHRNPVQDGRGAHAYAAHR